MKKMLLMGLLLLGAAGTLQAQIPNLPSTLAKELILSASSRAAAARVRGKNLAPLTSKITHWQQNTNLDELDFMLGNYFLPNGQAIASYKLEENHILQRKMVQHWLDQEYAAARQAAALQKSVRSQAVQGKINFLDYIPAHTRLLMLGEVHMQPWIGWQVLSVILQMQKAYPERHIYYASEFLYAHPDEPGAVLRTAEEVERFSLSNGFYQTFNQRVRQTGVRMVGLEDPTKGETEKLNREGKTFWNSGRSWEMLAPAGVRERNQFWAEIIRTIYEQDPLALVIVHAGNGHTSMNQLNSLSRMLQEYKPFVAEFSLAKSSNVFLEKYMPVPPQVRAQGALLLAKQPSKAVYLIQQLKSPKAAWMAGCHLSVKLAPNARGE